MPHQPTLTELRVKNIVACLEPAIALLNEVHDAFGTPFIQVISNITLSLLNSIKDVKTNKDECLRLMEHTHLTLFAIVDLHMKSETIGNLPPAILDDVGNFMETLHKIHTYIEVQQEGNRIKNLFRQGELNTLLKECHAGLQHAAEVFKIESRFNFLTSFREIQNRGEDIHRELLELISGLSDGHGSDAASSVYQMLNSSQMSSKSFSMLPSKPQIFHGRDSEVKDIVHMLAQKSPRIAILGPGGMGKTSLARTVLHHPDVTAKYEHRFFVPCDAAITGIDIAGIIGAHIGLKPAKDLTKAVIRYLAGNPTCLLILDNLETTWEPITSRSGVEQLLSKLVDIDHLALIITMRGAERPAKVQWTRPFLSPLAPLSLEAARQIFIDIADNVHDTGEMDQLIQLTDNMPLAVDLIAHLVDYDSCSGVLSRWETEKTALLSTGIDKRSNLDISIQVSLSSPRFASMSGAMDLLSLLSILPDGLSDAELVHSKLPIQNVLACKAVLLGTSLAFINDKKRLKSLVPIREHIQCSHPVTLNLVQALQKYFHELLDLYQKYHGSEQGTTRMNEITLNFANLHQVLLRGLHPPNPDLKDTLESIIVFNRFSRLAGHGWLPLLDQIPNVLPHPCDHRLEVQFITEVFLSHTHKSVCNPELLISKGISHLNDLKDAAIEFASYYIHRGNFLEALQLYEKVLTLAQSTGDIKEQAYILNCLAQAKWTAGEYATARTLAMEAQRLAKLAADLHCEEIALWVEAMCCRDLGDYRQSSLLLQRARELLVLCGMSTSSSSQKLMWTQAETHLVKSEYVEAKSIHLEIVKETSGGMEDYNHAVALTNIAQIDVKTGGPANIIHHNLVQANKFFSSISDYFGMNYCDILLAGLKLREGETVIARRCFEKCLRQVWVRSAVFSLLCLEDMADMSQWSSADLHWTSAYTMVYLSFARKSKQKLSLYKALRCLGDVFLTNGDQMTATNLFLVALDGFTYMDIHQSRADCMLRLGDIAKTNGDLIKATSLWTDAHPLFERSLQEKDVAKIDNRLTDLEREQKEKLELLHGINVPSISLGNLPTIGVSDGMEERAGVKVLASAGI